ncbi:hypothetical protein SELMODRAFT_129646 [Selaginella moellendorffii]|uniref:Pentacotripeptide-repeat region of PRORP domain-containing protein n=2 Tax=Selaginella moellendorffii TaxID=88036 RepID=D8T157_SELML|nr:hypothetical protein SELMODRAFT_129646 [Selaginella moellendorffii]
MPEKNPYSWTLLVYGYAQLGLLERALGVFVAMPEKDLVALTAMMDSYTRNAAFDRAVEIFNEAKLVESPDRACFTSALVACSHWGRVGMGMRVLDSMERDYGLIPGEQHYRCVSDLWARAAERV